MPLSNAASPLPASGLPACQLSRIGFTTSPCNCLAAQTALQQHNVTATAVTLLSTSLSPPVDAANAPSDAFPSAVASASSAGGSYPQSLPVAAIAGVAAGAAALFLAVRNLFHKSYSC